MNKVMKSTVKSILQSEEAQNPVMVKAANLLSEGQMQDLTIQVNNIPEEEVGNFMDTLDGLFKDMGMKQNSQQEMDEKIQWLLAEELTGLAVGDSPMTDEEREANKHYAAACSSCGGWLGSSGMSGYRGTADFCDCFGTGTRMKDRKTEETDLAAWANDKADDPEDDVCVNCGSDFGKGVLEPEDNCPDCGKPWNAKVGPDEPANGGEGGVDTDRVGVEVLDIELFDHNTNTDTTIGDLLQGLSKSEKEEVVSYMMGESQIQKRNVKTEGYDGEDIYGKWMDGFSSPPTGSALVNTITGLLGYNDITHFWEDNPGAVEGFEQFIIQYIDSNPEWRQAFERDTAGE